MIYLCCGEEWDLWIPYQEWHVTFGSGLSTPTPRGQLPYKKGAECNIDSSGLFRSHHSTRSSTCFSSLSFVLPVISSLLLMLCSARFPSFTTVILSARESFPYSDYYRCTKYEKCSPSFQPPPRTETDLMKTIDLRDFPLRHSGYFLPEYIIDDEETTTSDEDNDDEFRREKGIAHGLSNAITKTKTLIPRFWLRLSTRLGNRKGRPAQVVVGKHNFYLTS